MKVHKQIICSVFATRRTKPILDIRTFHFAVSVCEDSRVYSGHC